MRTKRTKATTMTLVRLCLIIWALGACDWTEREAPQPVENSFFPLEVGRFWVYHTQELEYFGEGDYEESEYFIRDEITEVIPGESGSTIYRVIRRRSDDRREWQNVMAYALRMDNGRIIRQIDNTPQIILTFPVTRQLEWNANALVSGAEEIISIEHLGSYEMGERIFPSAAVVRYAEEDDLITIRDNRYEVFAEGLGIVEQYTEVFSYCSRNDCLGQQIIQEGRLLHLKLNTHGSN